MFEQLMKDTENKMKKAIEALQNEYKAIRTGRASIGMLDHIRVEVYGQSMPLNQVATLGVPDAKTLTIEPWDKNNLKAIEKTLQTSDLGINPINDGKIIRLIIPALTKERKKEYVKLLKHKAEESRVSIRNTRREELDKLKKMEKASEISEDEQARGEKQVQEMHDKYIEEIQQLADNKETEIMKV